MSYGCRFPGFRGTAVCKVQTAMLKVWGRSPPILLHSGYKNGGEQQGSVRGYFGYFALALRETSGLNEEQEVIVKAPEGGCPWELCAWNRSRICLR